MPTLPGTAADPSAVTNHRILSVTSDSFEMSWLVSSTLNHTFQVRVLKGNETVQTLKTEEMQMDVSHLEAGVMYSVELSYETCGKTIISRQNVKTGKETLKKKIYIYTFSLLPSSPSIPTHLQFSNDPVLLTECFPPSSALFISSTPAFIQPRISGSRTLALVDKAVLELIRLLQISG